MPMGEDSGLAAPQAAPKTFEELGLSEQLAETCGELGWKTPSEIQQEAIPWGLQGRDLIALAKTGSGKTGAFALPIIEKLLANPAPYYALVISPTRELASQIEDSFQALGKGIGLKTVSVMGGIDEVTQMRLLAKKPHVIVATPGRLLYMLQNMKGFSLRTIKFLVLDEADRLLHEDFEKELDQILAVLPKERQTFLFSATMTSKVQKLQRASLTDPVKVEVASKYSTVDTLKQQYLFVPHAYKDTYLAYVLNELAGNTGIIFTCTCSNAQRACIMLRSLGFRALAIHGQMSQSKRLAALNNFKAGTHTILVATDVASRGLDIPAVDLVINFEIPRNSKDYVHRVGRTARAGRSGQAITFVTQYDVELFQRIEELIGKKMILYPTEEDIVLQLLERVGEAQRVATQTLKNEMLRKNGKRARDGEEEEDGSKVDHFEHGSAVGHHNKKSFNKPQKGLPGGFKGNKKFGAGSGSKGGGKQGKN